MHSQKKGIDGNRERQALQAFDAAGIRHQSGFCALFARGRPTRFPLAPSRGAETVKNITTAWTYVSDAMRMAYNAMMGRKLLFSLRKWLAVGLLLTGWLASPSQSFAAPPQDYFPFNDAFP